MEANELKFIAYRLYGDNRIRVAPRARDWLDRMPQRFGYRCLPLTMANQFGWEICCSHRIRATLNEVGIEVDCASAKLADNHFGGNVLSMYPGFLFRTPPDWDLFISGPVNTPKHGIYALSAVLETEWANYSFSMNWLMTEVGTQVEFEEGEPFCRIVPIPRVELGQFEPEIQPIDQAPEVREAYELWKSSRLEALASATTRWDKKYMKGQLPDGSQGISDHRKTLALRPFTEKT